jgi:sodium/hydrogen exchanger-like protein 6/7
VVSPLPPYHHFISLLTFSSQSLVQGRGLMAGIVSLLFCGITLKHYAYHTMSRRTQKTTKYMFAVLAQLSENFIFIYLGLNLFTQDVQVFKPLFILVSAVSLPSSTVNFPLRNLLPLAPASVASPRELGSGSVCRPRSSLTCRSR